MGRRIRSNTKSILTIALINSLVVVQACGKQAPAPWERYNPAQLVQNKPIVKQSTWHWPINGKVKHGFVQRGSNKNNGIDILGAPGANVVAASSGTVVYRGNTLRGYGNLLIIKHANKYLTAYAHVQNILVNEGDEVIANQVIAKLANNKQQLGLHFELRYQGKPIDPLFYLPKK